MPPPLMSNGRGGKRRGSKGWGASAFRQKKKVQGIHPGQNRLRDVVHSIES
jgi:hypothetical protein